MTFELTPVLDLAAEGSADLPLPCARPTMPPLPGAAPYTEAALGGEQRAALRLMVEAMHSGSTLSEASVRMIQPAMYDIGLRWEERRITVAQEHLATAISQNVLAQAYVQADFAPSVGRKALFACVAGNHHSLGLRMLSDAFETIGWDVCHLGADVPTADLVRQADESRADLLLLSLSLPHQVAVAREAMTRLRADLGSRCPPILVGGLATVAGDRGWRSLAADGWASDALHALEQAAA